ncbi:MAG TPA: CarD family transcriptional regulator, partial [Alphaproteobacteria bacterium]|nr:CarD family transcriptional regulator [Alphaproteobacteria bacterium]
MSDIANILAGSRRYLLAGAPEGLDARVLAELASAADGWLVHVARDDARMALLAEAVAFFAPTAEILQFPAWDTVPYDRVSPHGDISARRMDVLSRLAEGQAAAEDRPRLLITTVNAALQRLPPREVLASASLRLAVGGQVDLDALNGFLTRNGYARTGTVMEPGEYAQRGGILDIFPPGAETPLRLDFFGDTLESVRVFDPLSQRTTGSARRIELVPVSEVLLTEETVSRFRRGYRALFGAVVDDDPLYAAISEARKQAGMEHWLPLFYERLENVFDYLPDAALTVDNLVAEALEDRLAQVRDYYDARLSALNAGNFGGAPPYKPVPPEQLYLSAEDWQAAVEGRPGGTFSPYAAPAEAGVVDFGGKPGRNFAAERAQSEVNVFDALLARIAAAQRERQRVVIACYTEGSAERMRMVLADHGMEALQRAADWPAAAALPADVAALSVLGVENGFETPDLLLIGEQDVLGDRMVRKRRRSRRAEDFISEAAQLSAGDLVVHVEHGIGRYDVLTIIEVGGAPHDCLTLEYAGGDRLYVPVENIEVLSRYGSDEAGAQLDKLGGAGWQARKARLKERIREI